MRLRISARGRRRLERHAQRGAHRDIDRVAASHGGLVGGRPDGFVKAGLLGLVLNDAGVGMDDAGISRLPTLDTLGIPGATVRAASARIGDGRSCYEDGVISHVNATAARAKLEPGMATRQLIERLLALDVQRSA